MEGARSARGPRRQRYGRCHGERPSEAGQERANATPGEANRSAEGRLPSQARGTGAAIASRSDVLELGREGTPRRNPREASWSPADGSRDDRRVATADAVADHSGAPRLEGEKRALDHDGYRPLRRIHLAARDGRRGLSRRDVNVAARLVDVAAPGEVVASHVVLSRIDADGADQTRGPAAAELRPRPRRRRPHHHAHAALRREGDALAHALLGRRPAGRRSARSQHAPDHHAHLEAGEARAQAAARAAAERQPGVGVGRVVAEEALGAELARVRVAVARAGGSPRSTG